MIEIRDVGELSKDEVSFLSTQTLGVSGYMSMFLKLCYEGRTAPDCSKKDFMCDVVTYKNDVGSLNCWCILQNLLYIHEDYVCLSIWSPRGKRGNGYAAEMMEHVISNYAHIPISVWVYEDNAKFFQKFNKKPIHCFCSQSYIDTKHYTLFDFDKVLL